jgi:hypothetical protein
MFPPDEDMRMSGPDTEEEKEIKRDLITVFSQMITEPAPDELNELWKQVKRLERDLDKQLRFSLKKFTAR